MTTPSLAQQTGLSILVYNPEYAFGPAVFTARSVRKDDLTEKIETYSHTISAVGGFDEAQITVRGNLPELESWLLEGIGRHIEVYGPNLNQVWEGFVNEVTLSVGPLTATRGPLMDIANRLSLIYSNINTATNPPTPGIRTATAITNDLSSQNRYGILEAVLSTGGMVLIEANQVRDTYLAEHSMPETNQRIALGAMAEPTLQIKCLGYYHRLKAWVYNQIVLSGTQNLSAKIGDILDFDPNAILASTNADITTNALQVVQYEADDRKAWNILKELVAHGDASDNRYVFGVYENQRAVYEQIPSSYGYEQSLSDPKQAIATITGSPVQRWEVRPARWLLLTDFLIGAQIPTILREDPRALFIEKVTYTMPDGLVLDGNKISTVNQALAKMGLGGLSA